MWVYRLGPEKSKRMLLTGDLVTGTEAADLGLVLEAVPEERLDDRVRELAERMAGGPRNQLMMQRHTPEGMWFKRRAEEAGFARAGEERDSSDPIAPDVGRRMPGSR